MSQSAPAADIDLSWRMRDREAMLLADSMRASRLTLLHADPGVARSELLRSGVLPLLRRRASDAVGDEDREARIVIPFSDRRVRRAGRPSARLAERVVWFDAWGARPLAALQEAIFESLPEDAITYARSTRLGPVLAELSRRFDAQFLIILDSFERFWDPALTVDGAEQFIDEFSEAVESDGLRANFLLSVETLAEPRLDALRQRIEGFDASALQLTRWHSITAPGALPATSREVARAPAPVGPGDAALPVLRDAMPAPPVLTHVAPPPLPEPARARAALPERRSEPVAPPVPPPVPAASGPTDLPGSVLPVATAKAAAAARAPAKKNRTPRPPRAPAVKPEPIRTESVYAFIESTLSQTASDFAPWHDDAQGGADESDIDAGSARSAPPRPGGWGTARRPAAPDASATAADGGLHAGQDSGDSRWDSTSGLHSTPEGRASAPRGSLLTWAQRWFRRR